MLHSILYRNIISKFNPIPLMQSTIDQNNDKLSKQIAGGIVIGT